MCPDHRSTLTLSHTKVKPNATRKKVSEMKKKNNSKWYVQLNVRINFHAMNVQRFRRFRTFFLYFFLLFASVCVLRTQYRMMSLHNLSLPSTACFSNNKYPPSTFFSVCFRSFACWFVLLSLHIRLRWNKATHCINVSVVSQHIVMIYISIFYLLFLRKQNAQTQIYISFHRYMEIERIICIFIYGILLCKLIGAFHAFSVFCVAP